MTSPDPALRTPTLGEIVEVLEGLYPPDLAQSWDRCGLVTGDADAPVERILLAVDPTLTVLAEAKDAGATFVLTHHPLLLRGVASVAPTTAKGRMVTDLVRAGIGLYCAHTSADSAEPGVSHALADALGVVRHEPLAHREGKPLGRIGDLDAPLPFADFCRRVHDTLPTAPAGIRCAGDPRREVRRVAVAGGAGDDVLAEARAGGADVFVTADLRHHPALEDLELSAVVGGPALVDAGHFATEWPWLPVAACQVTHALAARGARVDVVVSRRCTDPWTAVLPGAPDPAPGTTPATPKETP